MNRTDHTTSDRYSEKAKDYHRHQRRAGFLAAFLTTAFLFLLLVSGWTFALGDLARQVPGGPAVWVLVYVSLAALILQVFTLPVRVYSGYVVEKKFGLLNQSLRAFWLDLVKARLVSLVLVLTAAETLYLMILLAGAWWWLPAAAVFAGFYVLLAYIAPVLLLPIFFKFKKLPDDEFARRLAALCRRAGLPVLGVYEWGLSTRTKKANAALAGWGPTRRVILSDTLLFRFTPLEIEVVVAHELGHHRLSHTRLLLFLQGYLTFLAFLLADLVYRLAGPKFGLLLISDLAGLPLLLLTFMAFSFLMLPLTNLVSRRLEQAADYFALHLTGLVGPFISALERLTALNLAEMNPHWLTEILFHSHPSPARRIQAAKDFNRHGGSNDVSPNDTGHDPIQGLNMDSGREGRGAVNEIH
ncbi:MAG: M48 family metallopeptidase [Pseudomonadota bacterium]